MGQLIEKIKIISYLIYFLFKSFFVLLSIIVIFTLLGVGFLITKILIKISQLINK